MNEGGQRYRRIKARLRMNIAYNMEKRVLSACVMVFTPPGASSSSSGTVSPNLALFCVVAKTGMPRI